MHWGPDGKAEYFSALAEGATILLAAGLILWTSVQRLLAPQPLEEAGIAAGWLTGWLWLDPVSALLLGVNILFTG